MEIQLINGVFAIEEAEQLLKDIFNIKIEFHQKKIRTIYQNEEDIKHSEKRIMKLEENLREAIRKLKQSGKTHTTLNAFIEVNTMERLTQ